MPGTSKTRKAAAKARSQHTRSKSKKQAKKLETRQGRVRVRKSVARGHGGRPRSQHKTKAWSVLQLHGV